MVAILDVPNRAQIRFFKARLAQISQDDGLKASFDFVSDFLKKCPSYNGQPALQLRIKQSKVRISLKCCHNLLIDLIFLFRNMLQETSCYILEQLLIRLSLKVFISEILQKHICNKSM